MQTYTVHEKRVPAEDLEERADDLIFVKEGFSAWTLFVPALWFLVNRLWRGFLLYIVTIFAVIANLSALGVNEQLLSWAGMVINLIFAFEARDIYRASLERRGYVLRGVVTGRNLAEAERRFLMEWLPEAQRGAAHITPPSPTGASFALASGSAATGAVPVIGMFPAHGG